ncbi:MAG: 23S rRNA (pseudouridine(1915)-N(3))-methyltransferase RlmH [Ruminiclostridium sp.]|nr:23S rRNA (pseudouridine(1915)-N(3))-methyltransferase RlmH [Ruminiclostridium sp.]
MVIRIIAVGKLKEQYLRDAFSEYDKRLSAFCRFGVDEVEQEKLPEEPSEKEIKRALETEPDKIIRRIPPGSIVIPLCIEGKQLSSDRFSGYIAEKSNNGAGTLVFVIGGSFGLSERVKSLADIKLCMYEMNFPHRLARIMLAEQIYRAFTIINKRKYHK